jgi:hypothetical protein
MALAAEIGMDAIEVALDALAELCRLDPTDINVPGDLADNTVEEIGQLSCQEFFVKICNEIYQITLELALRGSKYITRSVTKLMERIEEFRRKFPEDAKERLMQLKNVIAKSIFALFKQAVSVCPGSLVLEKRELTAAKFEICYEFDFSGGIEASITRLFKFVAGGKIQVTVEYS